MARTQPRRTCRTALSAVEEWAPAGGASLDQPASTPRLATLSFSCLRLCDIVPLRSSSPLFANACFADHSFSSGVHFRNRSPWPHLSQVANRFETELLFERISL